jgi:hypothetical protein
VECSVSLALWLKRTYVNRYVLLFWLVYLKIGCDEDDVLSFWSLGLKEEIKYNIALVMVCLASLSQNHIY